MLKYTGADIHTEGNAKGSDRARLIVDAPELSTAIFSRASHIHIHNIIVNGNRKLLGYLATGAALIEIGGKADNIQVDHIAAFDPRNFSALHIFEGDGSCSGAVIKFNEIGPSGNANGQWADGISLACRNSVVEHNIISDATDGGIVIFGAPGSVIRYNLIRTKKTTMLGGINLDDFKPFAGDYSKTVVEHNTLSTAGGFMKVGIAVGPSVWGGDDKTFIRGATIDDNTFEGSRFGYGIAIDGAEDLVVTGNHFYGRLDGVSTPSCYPDSSSRPARFVRNEARSSGTFQIDFVNQVTRYALCVSPPPQ